MTGPPDDAPRTAASRWRLPARGVAIVLVVAALAGVGAGFGAQRLRGGTRAPALPELHGQAVWATGSRPAPALSLRDQNGATVSLATLRGRPVLLTFLDSLCRSECPIEGRQLGSVLRRLDPRERPTLVVVSVDPAGDTPAAIRRAVRRWHLAGPWRWHWLNAPRPTLARVWRSYGITVDPRSGDIVHSLALYLVDSRGYERTAYLFPFLPAFVQGDLQRLARE